MKKKHNLTLLKGLDETSKLESGLKGVDERVKMGEVVKFTRIEGQEVMKNAQINLLKGLVKAIKRGQITGVGVVGCNTNGEILQPLFLINQGSLLSLIAACDQLKVSMWQMVYAQRGQ